MTYPFFPRSTAQAFPRTCEAACAVTHYKNPARWATRALWMISLAALLGALYYAL